MFDDWPHVQKRGNKYGIRRRVPDDVQHIIGKKVVTRSLGTGDPVAAKKRYHEVCAEIEADFAAAKQTQKPSEPPTLTPEMAILFAQRYFQDRLYDDEALAHRTINDPDLTPAATREAVRELGSIISQDLAAARFDGVRAISATADLILLSNGFPEIMAASSRKAPGHLRSKVTKRIHVDRKSAGYEHLLKATYARQIEIWERMLAILNDTPFDKSQSFFLTDETAIHQNVAHPVPGSNVVLGGMEPISIEEVFRRFWKANPPTGNTTSQTRVKKDMDVSYRVLAEMFGADTDANKLTKQDFRDLRDFVSKMPKQIGNKKKWARMSLSEIVAEVETAGGYEDDLLSPRSVNKYIRQLSKVFKWAANEPLISRNMAEGIFVSIDEEAEENRQPFNIEQLQTIFTSEAFSAPDVSKPAIYWASLLALYHGMRSEEILQLTSDDIRETQDGIWYIDVHRKGRNSLKNKSSIRQVPIHPELWGFGFQSFIDRAKAAEDRRLFHDIVSGAGGRFTPIFSKRYSRFLNTTGAKTKKTSFHSFRHTFRDVARNNFIEEETVSTICGWSYGSGTQADYGAGMWMQTKLSAIQKIDFPNLDLSSVARIDWR